MNELIHHFALASASRAPEAVALRRSGQSVTYGEFAESIESVASALRTDGLERGGRVATYLDKSIENVACLFGAAAAGGVFVPINPILKADQVVYILRDCNVRVLLTTLERWTAIRPHLGECPDLRRIVVVGNEVSPSAEEVDVVAWRSWLDGAHSSARHRIIDSDMAAILYTSGSTGKPKGVVLSHRNMVAGANSVAQYLSNTAEDRLLAILPLSFDYGLSQLTTAFLTGASVVLHDHVFPADAVRVLARERVSGLAAVPPLWMQLTSLDWPASVGEHLRYFTNSGGAMPTATLAAIRSRVPNAKPFLMYGLTEAFRSTYLPPEEIERRPTSMGKAIPNAEVLVVRGDGSECDPDEPGELVHRGALVSLGYWNDAEKTAERFKPAPGRPAGIVTTELAVWSGDTVRRDADGFLYFVGRRDEMIKTSGYRVSPTEIEEVLFASGLVAEAAAFGVPHPMLGQAVVVVALPAPGREPDSAALLLECKRRLPTFMVPSQIDWTTERLPRNANGKIDRKSLAGARQSMFGVA